MRSHRFDVSRVVTDPDAVNAITVDTWAQHGEGLSGKADNGTPAAFSTVDQEEAAALAKSRRGSPDCRSCITII